MKRVWIALILLPVMLTASLYAMARVEQAHVTFSAAVDGIESAFTAGEVTQSLEAIQALDDYWQKEADVLGHFIRHDFLDAISSGISLLYPLAEYSEPAWLQAELATLRRQVAKLREEEAFRIRDIF